MTFPKLKETLSMNRYLRSGVAIGLILFPLLYFVPTATLQHSFGVKEYDEFHHVLHPLEHEALPKNDFATIRARAGELVKLGQAITKLGVPPGTKGEHQDGFKKELKKFREALTKFRSAAKSGTDAQLKTTYSAVHDSFEILAGILPRN
jgi:hypothetical protein